LRRLHRRAEIDAHDSLAMKIAQEDAERPAQIAHTRPAEAGALVGDERAHHGGRERPEIVQPDPP